MDVSHTEHSHVIGKGGNNIKRVMEETGCHIHFPDSNRNNQAEKSNQVCAATQHRLTLCAASLRDGWVERAVCCRPIKEAPHQIFRFNLLKRSVA